jgi:hypothetical protein
MSGGDLADFLDQFADTERLVSLLMKKGIHDRIESLVGDRHLAYKNEGNGILTVLTDLSPGGKTNSLQEFEERLIMYQARGFHEVGRGGEVPTGEFECRECMAISGPGSDRCTSCESAGLERATIPSTLTLILHVDPEGRTNEELLDLIWGNSTYLTTNDPE